MHLKQSPGLRGLNSAHKEERDTNGEPITRANFTTLLVEHERKPHLRCARDVCWCGGKDGEVEGKEGGGRGGGEGGEEEEEGEGGEEGEEGEEGEGGGEGGAWRSKTKEGVKKGKGECARARTVNGNGNGNSNSNSNGDYPRCRLTATNAAVRARRGARARDAGCRTGLRYYQADAVAR
ncbi:hypothetical protein HZH66_005061 [Vespula vulgaris]|uniref:Uncharacterized protein n=1 Tax=Vespula vulgaris TaxID=7454 RepID=A0A834KDF0_VESVU|nr:hypothetical protein HZH66_005061 [Vespula vulgaris]